MERPVLGSRVNQNFSSVVENRRGLSVTKFPGQIPRTNTKQSSSLLE